MRTAPARAAGVTLIGEMDGSGYRTPPALVRRGDGQTLQVTPLLYATLDALDGERSDAEVAAILARATGRHVTEENARTLVGKLRELGLAARADGSQPDLKRSDPLLGLRFKVAVTDPERTRRLTAPFAALFNLGVVVPVLAVFAWVCWWVLVEKGLASATHEAFARPGLLLTVLAVTVLSAGFHEFGHAAATRRGGATPGVMGAGLYLVWPAFYTDVTDSYRLGRAGRLRTDLGGLYFNAIVAVVTAGAWWVSGYDAVLLLVATQLLQMVRQLLPLVRFDGYHVLADLTGVPDLFGRIGPILRSAPPWRPAHPEAAALRPWARAVVTTWVLVVVPVLLVTAVLMVLALPRLIGTAWAAVGDQRAQLVSALGDGDVVSALARAVGMLVVVLPVAAVLYILVRLVRQVSGAVWRRTEGNPVRRAMAGLVAATMVAGLGWAWWPDGDRYRPVQPWEGGTLADALALARPQAGLAVGSEGAGTVMWPDGVEAPTRERPQLAAVLVPTGAAADASGMPTGTEQPSDGDLEVMPEEGDVSTAEPGTWVFPFDEPLAPDEGDTQALAVNTTDGTTTYAVAFALVWADGDEPADHTNEAYALASCRDCAAVAVAFQVVLVLGETSAVAPQNISVAVNHECTSCLTYSLAVQLFATLDGPLSPEATTQLEALWAEILTYGERIGQLPLDEIQRRLTDFENRILDIIGVEPATAEPQEVDPSPSDPSVTPTATPTTTPSSSGASGSAEPVEPTATSSPTDPATTGPPAGEESAPTGEPTTGAGPTPAVTPSPSSSTSSSTSPSDSPAPAGSATPTSSTSPSP